MSPLPTSRNTTYAPGAQVKSADLNALEDQVIRLNAALCGTQIISGAYGSGFTITNDAQITMSDSADRAYWDLPARVGWRIDAVRVLLQDNATGTTKVLMQIWKKVAGAFTVPSGGDQEQSEGDGSEQTVAVSGTPQVVGTGEVYVLQCNITAANVCTVRHVEVDISIP